MIPADAEELYHELRTFLEDKGLSISDDVDERLADVTRAIAEDYENQN